MATPISVPSLFQKGYYWESKIFLTSVKLDIYSALEQGPQTAEAVAQTIEADPENLGRLLESLVAIGLLSQSGADYSNIPELAEFLVKSSPFYMGELMLLQDAEWDHWGKLEEIVRTGRPPLKNNVFINQPEQGAIILKVLNRMAKRVAPALAEKITLDNYKSFLDVGGGGGAFTVAFCERYPHLQATLFDLPQTLEVTRENMATANLSERVTLIPGNFNNDPIPGPFEVVFLSDILHYQTEAENIALFQKLYESTATGGLIVVKDMFMGDEDNAPGWNAVFSIHMMIYSEKGRCFKNAQIKQWLHKVGFDNIVCIERNTVYAATKGI